MSTRGLSAGLRYGGLACVVVPRRVVPRRVSEEGSFGGGWFRRVVFEEGGLREGLRVRIIVLSEGSYEGLLQAVRWYVDSVRGLMRGSFRYQKKRLRQGCGYGL